MKESLRRKRIQSGVMGGIASVASCNLGGAKLQLCLKGIRYPTNVREIIRIASSNHAPEDVMHFLNWLPYVKYERPTDLAKKLKEYKERE